MSIYAYGTSGRRCTSTLTNSSAMDINFPAASVCTVTSSIEPRYVGSLEWNYTCHTNVGTKSPKTKTICGNKAIQTHPDIRWVVQAVV